MIILYIKESSKNFLDYTILNKKKKKLPTLIQYSETHFIGQTIDKGGQAKIKIIKSKNKLYCFKYYINESDIEETERELNFLEELKDCPYVVKFYGRKIINNYYGLILEFCKGGNLAKYLDNHKNDLSNKIKLDIIFQFALALQYLQEKKIIHSDLKCENILIADESSDKINIRLSDFGGSLYYGKDKEFICITPRFAAPEMLLYEEPNLKSDIFSFASTCYYIFNLNFPFQNNEDIINCKLPNNFSRINNKEFEQLLKDCWKLNPNDRPSIKEIIKKIQKILNTI